MTTLDVPEFDPAVVSFPSLEATLSPVVFVAHGAGDHPVPQCQLWRYLLGDRGVAVCLSGKRTDVRTEPRYFPEHRTLEKILVATLKAFRAAYPELADPENTLYAGYSQGATMGSLVIHSHAADFPRVALVEGGYGGWTLARATAFAKNGGRRVLFMCGTRPCADQARASAKLLESANVETKIVQNLAAGHGYGPALVEPLKDAVPWLLSAPK